MQQNAFIKVYDIQVVPNGLTQTILVQVLNVKLVLLPNRICNVIHRAIIHHHQDQDNAVRPV